MRRLVRGSGTRLELDTFRGVDAGGDGAVGTAAIVADTNRIEGRRVDAFDPLEIAELRCDAETPETGLARLNPEDMLAEPVKETQAMASEMDSSKRTRICRNLAWWEVIGVISST